MNDGYRQAGSRGKRVERLKGRLRPYEVLGIKDEWVGAAHRQDAKIDMRCKGPRTASTHYGVV